VPSALICLRHIPLQHTFPSPPSPPNSHLNLHTYPPTREYVCAVCTNTHTHAHAHTDTQTQMHAHTHRSFRCMHTHTQMHAHTHRSFRCMHTHRCMHTARTHTCTLACTHIDTHSVSPTSPTHTLEGSLCILNNCWWMNVIKLSLETFKCMHSS